MVGRGIIGKKERETVMKADGEPVVDTHRRRRMRPLR